ncbi:MAG: SOS response-associated peptidase [Limnobacter sp.]|nr:SOS response-associated peptidase [Limnobacter sp.]
MCGRYVLERPVDQLLDHFEAKMWQEQSEFIWQANYNIAPTAVVPVVRLNRDRQRVVIPHQWGLIPHWAKDPKIGAKMNNARAETIFDKPSFRTPVRRYRCLVPASGYYEWQVPRQPKTPKQPWYIKPEDDTLFAMAGVCDHWALPNGQKLLTFAIVTCPAHTKIAHIHDRMPVMIDADDWAKWLDTEEQNVDDLGSLLTPSKRVEFYQVSRRVSATGARREDGPTLIEPLIQAGD